VRGLLCGLRETGPALAGKLWRGSAFAQCARGGVIASNARSGPIPLRCGFMGLCETGPALAGKLWRGSAFAQCARGGVIAGSSLFSVVFKPAGFIGFRTVTDSWFFGHPEAARGPPRQGPISERSGAVAFRSQRRSGLRRSDLRGGPSLQTWRFRRNRPISEVLGWGWFFGHPEAARGPPR